MPFTRPTLQELIDRTKSDFESRLTQGGSLLRRATVRVMSRVMAGGFHLLYGFATFIARQIMPDTAETTYLDRWARIWGVGRIAATFGNFVVTFTGTDGTIIPLGSELTRSDGQAYVTDIAVTIASGVALVNITAKTSGSEPNLEGGELLSLSSPIPGADSQATVSSDPDDLISGSATESDESLLERLLNRIQLPPNGGSVNDYEVWARSVAGVTRSWCYENYYGSGTVGVTFVRDNDVGSIVPSAGEVLEVADYIDPLRPATADVTVFAPGTFVVNFTISGISNLTVRAAVQAELEDLIRREGEPAGTLLLSHINEAISKSKGEVDHTLIAPVANVTTSAGVLPIMGTITWV